jgi:hypothetical protein
MVLGGPDAVGTDALQAHVDVIMDGVGVASARSAEGAGTV